MTAPGLPPLPFSLKVPSRDNLSGEAVISWTDFAFHGLMRFDGEVLQIEWSGTAATDEVEGAAVRSEILALPAEAVAIPLERLRTVKLAGGWWRPRLEITGNDMAALAEVPSEEGGRVRFWLRRGDRALAAELVSAMRQAARERPSLERGARPALPQPHTPPGGV